MAVDMFLKLDGITGESVDSVHKDEVDVLAWSWGASQSGTMHTGAGGGAGKVSVQDMAVTKYVDKASPALMKRCCDGTHMKEVILTVRKAGGKAPVEYLVYKLSDVIVTSISVGGSGGEDRLTENVTFNFAKFTQTYTPQAKDGTAQASIEVGWDIEANTAA